jgi:hypothetical protein
MNLFSLFSKVISAFLLLMALSTPSAIAQPKWQVAKHTTDYQDWQRMPVGSGFPVKTFAFHDFDGDGKTDVFTSYRGAFQYSSGGKTSWRTLNTRYSDSNTHGNGVDWEDLRFGDIDGDRKTDVFFPWKGNFVYVSAGKGDAIVLRKADVLISQVFIGDFDGDRKAEIFYKPKR